ncbi:hypothetical protein cypCar_00007396 [Cyprinus carpio]|nr:hypothetical protein cypCar_00007396 [Cyprinus carpio]
MEPNDKDTLEAEKQQMNGQTAEALQEMTTPKEPANTSENNSDTNEQENNEEETIVSNGDEEENTNEEIEKDEEEDELGDGFQPSVEMSIRLFEKDKGEITRPNSMYNTVSYKKIKRGNTKQRIDEFEFILDV